MRKTIESWNVGSKKNHRSLNLHPSNREMEAQTGSVPASRLSSSWKLLFFPEKGAWG